MKIFLPVKDDKGIESELDERFARASYFIIYDLEKDQIVKTEKNMFKDGEHGVGLKVAGFAVAENCNLSIGAKPGPKAEEILYHAGVNSYIVNNGIVSDVISKYKKGVLKLK
ncbi:MAG: NifB/NifX family molybdenum-iron cluster-binding protein [Acidobacteriota bacterium]